MSPDTRVWPRPESALAVRRGLSISVPSGGRAGGQFVSRMEPLALRIERDGRPDGRPPLRAEMIDGDLFAHSGEAVGDEAERDRAAERRADIARGHVALRPPRLAARDDMGAGGQRRLAAQ